MNKVVIFILLCCSSLETFCQTWTGSTLEITHPVFGNGFDYTALYRVDDVVDHTRLRLRMGDEVTSTFEIGYQNWQTGLWNRNFSVDGYGNSQVTGRLSIGTTAANYRLEVFDANSLGSNAGNFVALSGIGGLVGNNGMTAKLYTRRLSDGNDWSTARMHDAIAVDASFHTPGVDTKTWWERDPWYNIQSWGNTNETYMTLKNGFLGIGTINPDYRLTVNGKIKAEEIEVVVDVPADYVFEPDYKLMSLSEVSAYIKRNKHLPNIPSAEKIKRDGWRVGDMNNKLLEKIEELTLYIIRLEEKQEELMRRVKELDLGNNR